MKSLIIYSGGLDSTTLLYEFRVDIKLAITFDYGSKHNRMEYEYAKIHTKRNNIEHIKIDLPFINKYFKSNLLKSGGDIPTGHYQKDIMKKTVVPFRNGIMLSIACGLAETRNLDSVLIANHYGDHAIYPDCRMTFIQPFREAMSYGTYNSIELLSPYINLTKREISLKGKAIGIDYAETYSCYKGGENHCGICGTCVERKEALEGFDNTEYE